MSTAAAPGLSTSSQEHPIRVLLVDDQAIVGETVRRMLDSEKDIQFHFCQDATRAIAMAAEHEPTVILQDLVMPEVDGLTLVRFYRAHPKLKDVPLIVLSSKEEPATKAEAFARGAHDYLVKLPDRIELVARIRHHSRGYISLLERNEAYRALAAEIASAAEYVVSLLPKPVEEPGFRTDWRYIPSAQLGGDSFGYHWIDSGHFALYLLDVCGHGVGSALLSVSALNALRSQSLPGIDFRQPAAVVSAMNDAFQMSDHNNLYFTLWYGVYERSTRKMVCCSAGHPPALLYPPDGSPRQLLTRNPMVGGFRRARYTTSETTIPPSSRLYVFSDGVYEIDRPDGSMWSLDEFQAHLANLPPGDAGELDSLYRSVQKMRRALVLDDDFSIMKIVFD
jgi:phosphoserine phosphatase RsbU/P